jgi:hypothetical protein
MSGALLRKDAWKGVRRSHVAVVAMVLVASTAHAQPGALSGGALSVTDSAALAPPIWTIVGNAISAFGIGGDSGVAGGYTCQPCSAGDAVPIAGNFSGDTLGTGRAVVNGALYSPVYFGGVLNLDADAAVMPNFDGNAWANVAVPFSVAADSFLTGYSDSARTKLLFSIPLSGQGTATLHVLEFVDAFGTPHYDFRSVTYTLSVKPHGKGHHK